MLHNFFETDQNKNNESILGIIAAKAEVIRRKETVDAKN